MALVRAKKKQLDISIGDVLAGKYRVERVLGRGGMGVVVAATHQDLDEQVALKLLVEPPQDGDETVSRFLREAKAAAKIKSEHVARVNDVGRLDSGEPFIVMEYLEGRDLHALIDKRGPLLVSDAASYIVQACEALAEAHSIGIIHRDLKPGNLFLARRPDGSARIKVLDFGISKVLPEAGIGRSMTRTGTVMGSPEFMAPEQWLDAKAVDLRTDIWSLGGILYLLVSGERPFVGDSVAELCQQVMNITPPDLKEIAPELPHALVDIIDKCLEKDPECRYGNVAELAADLLPYAARHCRLLVSRMARLLDAAGLLDEPMVLAPDSELPLASDLLESTEPTPGDAPSSAVRPSEPQPEPEREGVSTRKFGAALAVSTPAAPIDTMLSGAVDVKPDHEARAAANTAEGDSAASEPPSAPASGGSNVLVMAGLAAAVAIAFTVAQSSDNDATKAGAEPSAAPTANRNAAASANAVGTEPAVETAARSSAQPATNTDPSAETSPATPRANASAATTATAVRGVAWPSSQPRPPTAPQRADPHDGPPEADSAPAATTPKDPFAPTPKDLGHGQ